MDKLTASQAGKLSKFLAHPSSKQINKKNFWYSLLQLYNADGTRPGLTRTNTQAHTALTPTPSTCACAYTNAYTGTYGLCLCMHRYRYQLHLPGEHRPCVH